VTRFNQQLEAMVQQRTEELKKALDSLARLDKNKSDFINVAAHELRTPLTIMKGYLGMLQGDAAIRASEYLLSAVDGVLKGTERLHEVVNSMLDVARIDNQVLKLMPEMVTISSIAKRVWADNTPYLTERRQAFQLLDLDGLPLVRGDGTQLLKVFQALVINAIKYTPDGGKISIQGRVHRDRQIGDCVEVLFRDTGIGIDPENQELIFEKLYSTGKVALHSSGKASFKGGGPGLGLAIAKGIVLAHGGLIWAESPGQDEVSFPGSTFHVLLPLSAPLEAQKTDSDPA
jgi:signal transduction histidine kinase